MAFVILLLVVFLILVVSVGTFGPIGLQHILYPSLSVLRLIHWRGFLIEKTGLFAIGVWTVLVFVTLSIQLWVATVGVVELLRVRTGRGPLVTAVLAALATLLSRVPRNSGQLSTYLIPFTAVGLVIALGLPLLVHAVAWLRGLGLGRRNEGASRPGSPACRPHTPRAVPRLSRVMRMSSSLPSRENGLPSEGHRRC